MVKLIKKIKKISAKPTVKKRKVSVSGSKTRKSLKSTKTKIVKKPVAKKLPRTKSKVKKPLSKTLAQKKTTTPLRLERYQKNPILEPRPYAWESQAAFNPGAVVAGGKVHLFYRALGDDGVSRIGYASSDDGINFNHRLTYPVFVAEDYNEAKKHWPFTSPGRLTYNRSVYTSGGGWGGCEDPRVVLIDGVVYMTFNMFNGWYSMRVAVTSINEDDLPDGRWVWNNFAYLSRPGERQKNWMLFPEKINGKFAVFYNLDKGDPNRVYVDYLSELDMEKTPTPKDAPDPQRIPDHEVAWHYRTRSAAAPPIKTKDGWLLLYHAMEKKDPMRYKVGALLLDLKDPCKVLARAPEPIFEPDAWYENDYKPGIVYASGAVVRDDRLFVYYGGGDKYVGVAYVKLDTLVDHLKKNVPIRLKKRKSIKLPE